MTRFVFLIALVLFPLAAVAQQGGLFAPRVIVNDATVSNYEYDQRLRMLTLFGTKGDVEKEALQGLIDDRLRVQAARQSGIAASPEMIEAGMTEFAGRANLTLEQFSAALAQGGVAIEALRDFIEAGVVWRDLVRAKHGPRITISEAEIDRALANDKTRASVRVLLSEIVLTAEAGNESQARSLANRLRREITTEEEFAAAARQYSSAGSAAGGGRLPWAVLSSLPPEVAPVVSGMAPGRVSEPLNRPGTVTLFFLREAQQGAESEAAIAIDYARYALPAGGDPATEAARVRAAVDTCDDLYGLAKGNPPEQLVRETAPQSSLPSDVAAELARLDDGEGTLIVRGGVAQYLMLCSRAPAADVSITREGVREALLNRRLASLAEIDLENLRQDAIIREY